MQQPGGCARGDNFLVARCGERRRRGAVQMKFRQDAAFGLGALKRRPYMSTERQRFVNSAKSKTDTTVGVVVFTTASQFVDMEK
jgi:hypothetical protein